MTDAARPVPSDGVPADLVTVAEDSGYARAIGVRCESLSEEAVSLALSWRTVHCPAIPAVRVKSASG